MSRTSLLASAAAAALLSSAFAAEAAPLCARAGDAITCAEPGSTPLDEADDALSIQVLNGASVSSPGADDDIPAIAVSGDAVSIANDGLIEHVADDNGGYAIAAAGRDAEIVNRGTIRSGDRGIEMFDEVEIGGDDVPTGAEGLTVLNEAGARIESRRQAVRSPAPGARVENEGAIVAVEGRALQLRGNGATVVNRGLLEGGEEVVEARGGFSLENYGTIRIGEREIDADGDVVGLASAAPGASNARPEDEDGVQFAGGSVDNHGLIDGTDDGIDLDEGEIRNRAGATIMTSGEGSGVDIDEVYDDGEVERANGLVRIVNDGLIEGARAVGTDDAAVNSIEIVNRGVLRGRSGVAVALAPSQGDSAITLLDGSEIYGDVLFGGGDDMLTIGSLTSGVLIASMFDGGDGFDSVIFDGYGLGDFEAFEATGDMVSLALMSNGDRIGGPFRNFERWVVDGSSYDADALAAAISAATPIPLPASLPLLAVGLGALAALRRRG